MAKILLIEDDKKFAKSCGRFSCGMAIAAFIPWIFCMWWIL